jgi:ribosome-associated protein
MAKTERVRTPRPTTRTSPRPRLPREVQLALDAAFDKKATEVTVLDLRKADAFTDYFVVCTGANARQVNAIADAVEFSLKQHGRRPSHVEGSQRAEWVLLDYFDFIVHVFSPSARAFYSLERLWGNAKRIEIEA